MAKENFKRICQCGTRLNKTNATIAWRKCDSCYAKEADKELKNIKDNSLDIDESFDPHIPLFI